MEGKFNISNLSDVNQKINELQKKCKSLKLELQQLKIRRESQKLQEERNKIAPEILDKQDEIEKNETQLLETKQYRDKIFGSASGLNEYIDRKLKTSNPNLAELIELEEYIYKEIADNKGISQSNKDLEDLYENIRKINQRISIEANIIETANYTGLARTGLGLLRVLSGSRNEKTDHKDPEIKSAESMKYHILHEQMKMKSCLKNQDTASSRGSSDSDVKIFASIMTETEYGKALHEKCNNEFKELIKRIRNEEEGVEVKDLLREAQNSINAELISILNDLQKMDNQKYVKYGFDLYREENEKDKDSGGIKYLGQEQTKKYLKENKISLSELYKLTSDVYLDKMFSKSKALIGKLGIKSKKELENWVNEFLLNTDKEKDNDEMDQISFANVDRLDENDPKKILHDIICENGFYLGKDIKQENGIESLTKNKENNSQAMQIFTTIASLLGGAASVSMILIPIIAGVALAAVSPVLPIILPILAIPLLWIVIKNVVEMVSEKIRESRDGVEQNVEKSIEKAQEVAKNRGKEAGLNAALNDINQRYDININFTPEERKQLFDSIKDDKESSKKLQKAIMNKIYDTPRYKKKLEDGINSILKVNDLEPIKGFKSKFNSIEEMESKLKEIIYTDLVLEDWKKSHQNEKEEDLKEIIKESMILLKEKQKSLFNGDINKFRENFDKTEVKKYSQDIESKLEGLKENKSESTEISDKDSEKGDNNPYKNNQYGNIYNDKNNITESTLANSVNNKQGTNMIKNK
jgi:hypothetical protein